MLTAQDFAAHFCKTPCQIKAFRGMGGGGCPENPVLSQNETNLVRRPGGARDLNYFSRNFQLRKPSATYKIPLNRERALDTVPNVVRGFQSAIFNQQSAILFRQSIP